MHLLIFLYSLVAKYTRLNRDITYDLFFHRFMVNDLSEVDWRLSQCKSFLHGFGECLWFSSYDPGSEVFGDLEYFMGGI